jgi:3-dehydroquinate dehydratase/pimeloyl-ACP methyl ester carboxylesterase
MTRIVCINGPNLDLLGTRDPAVYGTTTLARLEEMVVAWGKAAGCVVECHQTNAEHEMIDLIHAAAGSDGILLNGAALSHSSVAIADAVRSVAVPMVEVHISHIAGRERWRRRTHLQAVAVRTISGRGVEGYRYGLLALVHHLAHPARVHRYGPHPDQVIDLWEADSPSGSVLLVHGGFWRDAWGRDTVAGWGADLARRGISAAALGYRRLGSGGGVPATLDDVAEAAGVARGVLPGPWVMVGHSAGAHLATWLAATRSAPPLTTVGVGGIYDLRAAAADHLGAGAVDELAPDGNPSPVSMPAPHGPTVLVHGSEDDRVPPSQSVAYARMLEGAGASVVLDQLSGVGHFEVLDPAGPVWRSVVSRVEGALAGG